MFFKYSGYDAFGKKVNGKIEATDLNTAKLKLKQKKIIYEDIKDDGQDIFSFFNLQKKYKLYNLPE